MDKAIGAVTSATELLELAESENDEGMAAEIERDAGKLETDVRKLEFKRMFRGEMDSHNAFLDIQAGAGGTEAQDWAQMLLRMYLKWAASRGFDAEVIDSQAGEVAGMKSATIEIKGDYAYGWLRTETGVHRLVRKSPFDSGNRRHTSFASVFISPGSRRRHQGRPESGRHQDGCVPFERRRRPAREQDRIGGAPHARTHRASSSPARTSAASTRTAPRP